MKKCILFLIIILLFVFSYFLIFGDKGTGVSELPLREGILTWQGLTPSLSTKEDVVNILGEPEISFVSEEDELLCMYWTAEEKVEVGMVSKNSVCVFDSNNKVGYIKIVEPQYFYALEEGDLIKEFGEPSRKMISGYARDSWVYIYANEGFAYLLIRPIGVDDENEGDIILKYIFQPMSQEEFNNTFKWEDSDIVWEEEF